MPCQLVAECVHSSKPEATQSAKLLHNKNNVSPEADTVAIYVREPITAAENAIHPEHGMLFLEGTEDSRSSSVMSQGRNSTKIPAMPVEYSSMLSNKSNVLSIVCHLGSLSN